MISFDKITYAAGAELIAHKKNRTVSSILLGFAGVFYGFGMYMYYTGNLTPSGIALFIYAVSLICLYSACTSVFKDMYDIPTADVQMSMPLNSTERYASRLLTIFYIWLLPFLISAVFGFLMSMVSGTSSYNNSISTRSNYYSDASPAGLVAEFNAQILLYYIETVLFIIAVTVICQCCIGSKAESKYMPVLVMAVINSLPAALKYSVMDKFANVQVGRYNPFSSFLAISLYVTGDADEAKAYTLPIIKCIKCIVYLAAVFCGVFIYKKRDARSVGKPIVFKVFFEIVTGFSLFLFFSIAHMGDGAGFTAMFLAWLGSIILRLIVSRKSFAFSKVLKWTGLYAAYYAVFLVFMFAAFITGGFGAISKIPDRSELSEARSISISIYRFGSHPIGEIYEYSWDKEVNSNLTGDMDALKNFLECVSETAKQQSRVKPLYAYKMFGSSEMKNVYKCHVDVFSKKKYEQVYSAEFYLTQDSAEIFIGECKAFNNGNGI